MLNGTEERRRKGRKESGRGGKEEVRPEMFFVL
jgi:hypothetical protein